MNRLAFPFAPDMGIFKQHKDFIILRNHVYRQENVKLAKYVLIFLIYLRWKDFSVIFIFYRGCELKKDVVIFEKSTIGENSMIERSVIGKNCKIGNNCSVLDSFIMDNCIIDNDCHIKASLLCSNCTIKQNVVLDQVISGPAVQLDKKKNLKDVILQNFASPHGKFYIIIYNVKESFVLLIFVLICRNYQDWRKGLLFTSK